MEKLKQEIKKEARVRGWRWVEAVNISRVIIARAKKNSDGSPSLSSIMSSFEQIMYDLILLLNEERPSYIGFTAASGAIENVKRKIGKIMDALEDSYQQKWEASKEPITRDKLTYGSDDELPVVDLPSYINE